MTHKINRRQAIAGTVAGLATVPLAAAPLAAAPLAGNYRLTNTGAGVACLGSLFILLFTRWHSY